jgi:molybdopterin-binding protein
VIVLEAGRIAAEGEAHVVLPRHAEAGARLRTVLGVQDEGEGAVRLENADVRLVTRAGPPCRFIAVPADAVILARTKPTDTTAANVLDARVVHVDTHPSHDLVHVHLADGHPPLLAEVTHASRSRLGLEKDVPVAVILKATSIERF